MARLLRMPEVAANAVEAVLAEWPVPENTPFSAQDSIATVETEKAVVDVPADANGVIPGRRSCRPVRWSRSEPDRTSEIPENWWMARRPAGRARGHAGHRAVHLRPDRIGHNRECRRQ